MTKENNWTPERLGKLDQKGLQNLRKNAETKGVSDLVSQCDEILGTMNIRSRGGQASGKSREESDLQSEGDGLLSELGGKVIDLCDLSEIAARKASEGTKGYRYLSPLGKNGKSKLGGNQRNGTVAIDRYISYRVGNDKVSIGLLLAKGQPVEQHRWILSAPDRLLKDQKPVIEIVPGMADLVNEKNAGVVFAKFEDGAARFEEIICQIAPERS